MERRRDDDEEEEGAARLRDPARLGALLLEAGMPGEAAQVMAAAARVEPGSADLWRRLALARFQSGDRRGGVAASRRALRLDPACVVSMHNLALSALERGRSRVAAGWIARGLRIDPHDDGLRRLRVRLWLSAPGRILGLFARGPRARTARAAGRSPAR